MLCISNKVKVVKNFELEGAGLDEQWSFVRNKKNQRWLWLAIDHNFGFVLAYVLGKQRDNVFKRLKKVVIPFGIEHYYSDNWCAYQCQLVPKKRTASKANTQKIERKT